MNEPVMSDHISTRTPSAIRDAQIRFSNRKDNVKDINLAIGNIDLPMHPKMQGILKNLTRSDKKFSKGIVKYSATIGDKDTNKAFLNSISSCGFNTKHLYSQITDGASHAMELSLLATSGKTNKKTKPALLIDPVYTNYISMAQRLGIPTISITRKLKDDGTFTLPDTDELEKVIKSYSPSCLVIIPYDNPTGQFFTQDQIDNFALLTVKHNMWLISDEAYRPLQYTKHKNSSIWGINTKQIKGIVNRRISLESASKVFNACGLRIGALITDNHQLHEKLVFENTANLCPPAIAQKVFASISEPSKGELRGWFEKQKNYYKVLLSDARKEFLNQIPGIIVSKPQAAIYLVIDLKNIVDNNFSADKFVQWCAEKGKIKTKHGYKTLLLSPMAGFYTNRKGKRMGRTQMRIAAVEGPETMKLAPEILNELLKKYNPE